MDGVWWGTTNTPGIWLDPDNGQKHPYRHPDLIPLPVDVMITTDTHTISCTSPIGSPRRGREQYEWCLSRKSWHDMTGGVRQGRIVSKERYGGIPGEVSEWVRHTPGLSYPTDPEPLPTSLPIHSSRSPTSWKRTGETTNKYPYISFRRGLWRGMTVQ